MAADKLSVSNLALSLVGGARITTFGETTTEEGRVINAVYDDVRDMVLKESPWTFAQKRAELVDMTKPDPDDWETDTDYVEDDVVEYGGTHYTCLVDHTSDVFTDDLTSVYWETTTDWVTDTTYSPGDQVYNSGIHYTCLSLHTSGTFATDLTSVYWIVSERPAFDEDSADVVYYLPTDFLKLNMVSDKDALVKLEGTRLLSDSEELKISYTYQNDTPSYYSADFRVALATRIAAEICYTITNSANKAESLLQKYEQVDLPKAMSSDSQQGTPTAVMQDEWENAMQAGSSGIKGRTTDATWHPVS